MNNQDALNHLLNLALKGEPAYHPGYRWTVDYSDELKAYFGDVNIDKYMKMFARRESKELFEQSKQITSPVQGSLGNILRASFAKLERSNWVKYVTVGDEDKGGKLAAEFEKTVLNRFGTKGMFSYAFERLLYWNIYDPNCFTVVEFGAFDNNKANARPYPFEVTAEMAVDFKYDQSDLLYLCALQVQEKEIKGGKQPVKRLTMYRPMQTVVLQQLTTDEIKAVPVLPLKERPFGPDVADGDTVMYNNDVYRATIPEKPNLATKTPAARMGYVENPMDDGKTKLSIFHPALPYAKAMLKTNRELQTVSALLAQPIPFRAQDVCDAKGCIKGELPDGAACDKCHGTGHKLRPTTASEEIVFPMPDTPGEMFDPTKLMGYIHFPVEAAQMLMTLWDKWREMAVLSLFNSELTTKSEVAQTARFHAKSEQGMNDTLWPFGVHISAVCAYLSGICGDVTGYKKAVARPIIPANLRFDTVYDVSDKLQAARDAGMGAEACAELQAQAMEIILQDNPEALKRWRIDDSFDPFRGMTEAQILTALQSTQVPEAKKVFYQNRSDIMADILSENEKFYTLGRAQQKRLIDEKVKMIQAETQPPALKYPALAQNGQN